MNKEDVVELLKNSADKVRDGAEKLTNEIIGKTGKLVGKAKLKYAASETEKKLDEVYASVGRYIYNKYSELENDEVELKGKFQLIRSLEAELEGLEIKLSEFED